MSTGTCPKSIYSVVKIVDTCAMEWACLDFAAGKRKIGRMTENLKAVPRFAIHALTLFALLTPSARSEDSLPYGAALFASAGRSLERYLTLCLETETECPLTTEERSLVQAIVRDLSRETNLQFLSERDNPGYFDHAADSPHRIAVTGHHVGDPININLDAADSVPYFVAVALLVHELGHHQGITDTPDRPLDHLGAKVATMVRQHSEFVTLDAFGQDHVGVLVENRHYSSKEETFSGGRDDVKKSSQIFLFDGRTWYDYGATLRRNLPCPLSHPELAGMWLNHVHSEPLLDHDPSVNGQAFAFEGDLEMACRQPGTPKEEYDILRTSLRFGFALRPNSGTSDGEWWRQKAGYLDIGSLQGVVVQKSNASYIEFFQAGGWNDLTVDNVDAATALAAGDTWRVKAIVHTEGIRSPSGCFGEISSTWFVGTLTHRRRSLRVTSCRLEKIDERAYRLYLEYRFPEGSPSRQYFLESLALTFPGSGLVLSGAPTFRRMVHVTGRAGAPVATVRKVSLAVSHDHHQRLIASGVPLDRVSTFTIASDDTVFLILSVSGVIAWDTKSFALAQLGIQPRMGGRVGEYVFQHFVAPEHQNLPYTNRAQVRVSSDGGGSSVILSVGTGSLSEPNRVTHIEWKYFYGMDSSLNEILQWLPIAVKVSQ